MSSTTTRGRALSHDGPRLTARAAVLLVVMMAVAVLALVPARQYLDQRARIADLETDVTQLERHNERLTARIERLHDPVVLERLARRCLGMIGEDEEALVVAPGAAPANC